MNAKRAVLKIFMCVLLIAISQGTTVAEAAAEQTTEEFVKAAAEQAAEDFAAAVTDKADMLDEGVSKLQNMTAVVLQKVIKLVPYVGATSVLVGIFVAIFSTRNKGSRRWGLKLAITAVVMTYILYIALNLVCDYVCYGESVQFSSRPEQESFYEKAYYDTVAEMKNEGQSFLFLGKDWINGVMGACQKMYMSIAWLLGYVSISIGVLLLLVTKRDKAIRRFALAGMCIASPVTLMVGYLFLM